MGSRVRWSGVVAILVLLSGSSAGCSSAHELNGVRVARGVKGRSLDPSVVAERSAGAVGVVVTDTGRGLGFVVDPSGYMITNRHVVEDADYIDVVSFPGLDPAPEFTQVEIVYIDPVRDLALLRVITDTPLPYLTLATGTRAPASDYVTERDTVVLLSREVGPEEAAALEHDPGLLAHTGRVERIEVYNPSVGPGPYLGVSAQIEQGQSGGPVLDRWGRAVGVVTWTWKDQKGGFAIPISEAARMLAERPKLETKGEQRLRAEDRAKSYLAALGTASADELRRLTSPSRAREVRDETVDVLFERSIAGTVLQTFVGAIEELLADAARGADDPFPVFERMVEHTGTDAFMRKLGVEGSMSKDAVVTFFHEMGSAYMAARWFGDYDRREALMVAVQRVHSLDAARNIALIGTLEGLAGVRALVEGVEVTPGFYAPQATVTVDIGHGKKLAVQMRLEWGDWYVVGVESAS
ncbi:putative serine protease HtrA [Enhygromyxa salina]|uniref:Putative serine protease HtrA n=1 Tax=Enhygromyxa salina TaxID=215803 RepID=A0A2S9YI02_9BACT|nr:serine protease [Enhygromyxa salina]PRQ04672.1 putative serine protease HtrA [Enhygromyxa salina]